jgi:DNA-directed RNA polymerase specialized sigma24 family protein
MDIQQIIEAARAGDDQAKAQFIAYILQEIRPKLYQYSQGTDLESDDLLQDISLRLVRYWHNIMASNQPTGYAMITAKHVLDAQLGKVLCRRGIVHMISLDNLQIAL